jgi:xanthine/uracil permease
MLILVSSFVVFLIAIGIVFHRKLEVHIPLMVSAFVIDVALVLIIELQRHAVEKVIGEATSSSPSSFVIFHACVSLLVILFYIALGITGSKTIKDRTKLRVHKKLAYVFICLRLINYVTSFWMA